MSHITVSKLYFVSRCFFYQTSPQLVFRNRIRLAIEVFWLLVWGIACLAVPPAQASNHTVRFAVIGDYGGDTVDESSVANLVHSWNPDFIITTGDNNYASGAAGTIDPNIGKYFHDFIFPYTGSFGAGASTNRFFPSLGNHDWGDVLPPSGNASAYLNYFTLPGGPGNERYYEVVVGPVHLFALDSDVNEQDGITSMSTQASWLQGRLAASTAPWRLVFFHHPPYSSGSYWIYETQWPFQAWGASAVLSGHDHLYERLIYPVSTGIPYFINGLGGYTKFDFAGFCSPGSGANPQCAPGSLFRYNADFGAMLVEASPTCLKFQFISQGGTPIDSYTIPNSLPAVDYYVRDWTDSPTSGDPGAVPSTHSNFYTTSDVWNRQSNAPGAFNANNQPQNEDPKNGLGAAGDNFAFARIFRNTCGNGPADTVTAHFLYSEFGTGSNFQTAGSASGTPITFAADTLTGADTVETMSTGHSWHLATTSSTHLCLATEISTPSDPAGPTLLGHAPGWPTTDNMVLNDNNKAQRNMGVHHMMMKSIGKWSFYALAHNAATYKRSMVLRYEAPPEVSKLNVRLEVIHPHKIPLRPDGRLLPRDSEGAPAGLKQFPTNPSVAFRSGETLILEDMQPGENRWIGVTFDSAEGEQGESFPVSFFEVVNNRPVNGFTIAAVPAPWPIVSRDILKFHASVFARLDALFGIAKAKKESVEAARVLQSENVTDQVYVGFLRKQIRSMNDIVAELMTSQQSADLFGIRVELKTVTAAVQEAAPAPALAAHSAVLHKLDAFLTMLQKEKGDPADILQNVVWQTQLFRRLPKQNGLECSKRPHARGRYETDREGGDVEIESKEFIRAYEARRVSNVDYTRLISDLIPCFRETAKEFGGMVRLEADIANMVGSLDSPVALQKAHHQYLLKLQNVANKP